MNTATLTYTTANVCEIPRHDKTIAADFTEVRRAVGHGVIMWQELGNDVYRGALHDTFPAPWAHFTPGPDFNSAAISYDTSVWGLRDSGSVPMSGLDRGIERPKFVNYVILERVGHPAKRIVVTSRHYVARGFNPDGSDKPRHDKQEAQEQPQRRAIWHEQNHADRALVARFVREGYPVVIGGDFNRANVPAFPTHVLGHKVTAVENGIDWLYFIDSDRHQWHQAGLPVKVATHSDHKAVVQGASLAYKARIKH